MATKPTERNRVMRLVHDAAGWPRYEEAKPQDKYDKAALEYVVTARRFVRAHAGESDAAAARALANLMRVTLDGLAQKEAIDKAAASGGGLLFCDHGAIPLNAEQVKRLLRNGG